MKFGKLLKKFISVTNPEWAHSFLDYKQLKKRIKHLRPMTPEQDDNDNNPGGGAISAAAAATTTNNHPPPPPNNNARNNNNNHGSSGILTNTEEREFVMLINEEMKKFNEFFIDKEEEYVIKLKDLDDQLTEWRTSHNDDSTPPQQPTTTTSSDSSQSDSEETLARLRTSFVTMHGELVLLLSWSQLNYQGLVKILKKHDKHSSLTLKNPFLQNALQQPFKSDGVLKQLVDKAEQRFLELSKTCSMVSSNELLALAPPQDPDAECTEDLKRRTEAALTSWQSLTRPGTANADGHNDDDDDDDDDSDDDEPAGAGNTAKRARTT